MMKLLVQAAMIFFGTLLAAGLLALGDPRSPALVLQLQNTAVAAATAPTPAPPPAWLERTANAQPGR